MKPACFPKCGDCRTTYLKMCRLAKTATLFEQPSSYPIRRTAKENSCCVQISRRRPFSCVPQARLVRLSAVSPRLEQLSAEAGSFGAVPSLKDNIVVVSAHHASTLQRLQSREKEVNQGTFTTQCENNLSDYITPKLQMSRSLSLKSTSVFFIEVTDRRFTTSLNFLNYLC